MSIKDKDLNSALDEIREAHLSASKAAMELRIKAEMAVILAHGLTDEQAGQLISNRAIDAIVDSVCKSAFTA